MDGTAEAIAEGIVGMQSISLRIRRAFALGLIFFAGAAPIAPVAAQTYPNKPIEIVNSFAPGGSNDLNIRALEADASRILGQPLVQVFNPGGAA